MVKKMPKGARIKLKDAAEAIRMKKEELIKDVTRMTRTAIARYRKISEMDMHAPAVELLHKKGGFPDTPAKLAKLSRQQVLKQWKNVKSFLESKTSTPAGLAQYHEDTARMLSEDYGLNLNKTDEATFFKNLGKFRAWKESQGIGLDSGRDMAAVAQWLNETRGRGIRTQYQYIARLQDEMIAREMQEEREMYEELDAFRSYERRHGEL